MTSSADDLDPSSSEFWTDLFTDDPPDSSAKAPPAGGALDAAMESPPPPQHTGVRPRTSIDAAIAHHDSAMRPAKMPDEPAPDTDPCVVVQTLRPEEEKPKAERSGLPQGQGIPGTRPAQEAAPRNTLRGRPMPPAELAQGDVSSPWGNATPLYVECPTAVAVVEAELRTRRPPAYAEKVASFQAEARDDNLTLHPESELDVVANTARGPFIPRPPQLPRMEPPTETTADEQLDVDEGAPTTIPSPPLVEPSAPAVAIVDAAPPDATNDIAADAPVLSAASSRIRWMDVARQHRRPIAVGILLALFSLSWGIWYLADNWWYYNPF